MPPKTPIKPQSTPSKKGSMVDYKGLEKLSAATFLELLEIHGMYKERSEKTFEETHRPALEKLDTALSLELDASSLATATASLSVGDNLRGKEPASPSKVSPLASSSSSLQTVLIGDSLIERLKTTGKSAPILTTEKNGDGSPIKHIGKATLSPSSLQAILIGSSAIEHMKQHPVRIATMRRCINLGVGGDRIENVLYRLALGTYDLLVPHSLSIKLVVVQVGTNNLRPKRSFTTEETWKYGFLIRALLRIAPKAHIICCGMFPRSDISDAIVKEGNAKVDRVIDDINGRGGGGVDGWVGRVEFLPAPEVKKSDFDDHVHLNRAGYEIWSDTLWPIAERILAKD